MNIFAAVILAAVLVEFTLSLVANILNLKALKMEPPALLADIYTVETYRKSQEYTRENTRFGFISGSFSLVLLLAFWFSGGFDWLDGIVRSCGFTDIINGILYMAILGLAYSLITLPFSIYATFVIEERYGFNKTTPRTFILDRLKGAGLAALLGAPLLAGILALFQYAGPYAWLLCWGAVTLYSLIIEFVAPNWIMPLFNKFTPMQPGELRDAILSYAGSVNFPVQNIFVMDGSRRSSKSNAFFTGFGRNKRIALFDTLIAQHSTGELVAVLAHEIGHYKKKHILQGVVISILHAGLVFFLLSFFLNSPGLYQAFYMQQPSVYSGLIFFGLLYTPLEMIIDILLNMLSRKNEYEADRFAALTVEDSADMVRALKKLAGHNLSNLTPHPFYAFLNYTHPPLLQRVKAIRRSAVEPSAA
ncbi:MAG: M48 family metallopeptidase [Dehalococcoidia bacterium]|nr:M48 family metallopeptidase [Dehalococcoidia bacterium]MDD5494000.1 M48 family metallopeptidase [Dehalococcoidia bacterium]